jgi:hypothetical protein
MHCGCGELLMQRAVDHFSVDDRQHGMEFPDRFIGNLYRIEIVVAQHDDIAELADFDRAQFGFLFEEPAVVDCVKADRLFTCGS